MSLTKPAIFCTIHPIATNLKETNMAYITKAEVQAKSVKLKAINKKYGVSARFSGSNSGELRLTVTKGSIKFEKTYEQVNHYYLDSRADGSAKNYLKEVYALMKEGHFDDSDYFHCSWYNSIHIGKWDAPYVTL
jgi:hypothetical protein